MAVGLGCVARGRIGDRELQRLRAEGDLDLCAAPAVPRRIGQRLLENPVGGPVDGRCEVPATAVDLDVDGKPRRAMAFGERLEGGEPRRRFDLTPVGGAVLAENAHELVDLPERLACDFLDRLQRGSRSRWILLLQQACSPGLDEDHVDRVAGGVVEVTGDAGAFLRGCQASLALGLALGPQCPVHELGQARAALTDPVADDPRAAPDKRAGEERYDWKLVLGQSGSGDVEGEEPRDDGDGQLRTSACGRWVEAEKEESDGWPERRPRRIVEPGQGDACRRGDREHGEGRSPAGEERERAERGQGDAERVEAACVQLRVTATGGEHQEREDEHACGDDGVRE